VVDRPDVTTVIEVVDAFTDRPFTGNPAGVCLLEGFPEVDRMQALAREMNLAETAFAVPRPDGDFDLRWFTPAVEVDLCGHATLATAHLLGRSATFHTRSGPIPTRSISRPQGGAIIELDFPADPPSEVPVPAGVDGVRAARGRFDLIVEMTGGGAVREYRPDLAWVAALGTRGLVVTAAGDRPGIDFVSRVFLPNVGIPEDPVTGSAHCTLAGYWGPRAGKENLVGEQASPRGGVVHMRPSGNQVVLGGQAVTVSEVRVLV
jgi:predicted PhzF superfamily epimerase YddE/YHI9